MTFNRFAGLGTLHALRTLVFRSRTAWLRRFQGRERDVRDESASVCLGGAGRQCIEAVLHLATDEVRVDVRAPSRCQANAIVDPLPNVKLTPLVFGSVRWPLGFQGRRAMQPEPGLALLPEPIALALDHEGVAVMQESIEDGGGDDVVAEDLTPLRHALIRRDQHRRFLVAMAHELKEEMSTLAFERHVAELVDDEQLPFAVEEHPTREDALALAVDEVGEERRRRGEEHGVASLDDGAAEGDRQVRLADAGRNSHILRSFRASPPFTIPGTRSSARR